MPTQDYGRTAKASILSTLSPHFRSLLEEGSSPKTIGSHAVEKLLYAVAHLQLLLETQHPNLATGGVHAPCGLKDLRRKHDERRDSQSLGVRCRPYRYRRKTSTRYISAWSIHSRLERRNCSK